MSRRQGMFQQADEPEPQPPASTQPAGGTDITAELEKIASLHSQGVLTDEEFAAAKAKLLGV